MILLSVFCRSVGSDVILVKGHWTVIGLGIIQIISGLIILIFINLNWKCICLYGSTTTGQLQLPEIIGY